MKQFLINHPIAGAFLNTILPGSVYLILQTRVPFGVLLILGFVIIGFTGSQTTTPPRDASPLSVLGGVLIWLAFGVDGYFECKSLQKKK